MTCVRSWFGPGFYCSRRTCRLTSSLRSPKPEHPRPDARRAFWANLNGRWEFRFDANDQGLREGWEKPDAAGYDRTIVVPFPWESELSGIHQVKGAPKIGWYRRRFTVPKDFPAERRVWLRFGAVDWRADVWVNGRKVAEHEGGYTPFEADISDAVTRDGENVLVVRAFDPTDPNLPDRQAGRLVHAQLGHLADRLARGEAEDLHRRTSASSRPSSRPRSRFTVDVAGFDQAKYQLSLGAEDTERRPRLDDLRARELRGRRDGPRQADRRVDVRIQVRDPKLWTPEDPHLYDVTLELKDAAGKVIDSIETYFGLRTIGRGKYGDEPFERILLNGKPLYLRAALDQSFNPKGLYTAPDDDFFKRDMVIAKTMGLNGLRIHIKPDEPRRLYWADRLGVLIMEDMPNTWRQIAQARAAWEQTMREAVARDRNHPSIIAWVAFNETWGLGKAGDYKKDRDTQSLGRQDGRG